MKEKLRSALSIIIVFLLVASCTKDAPIYPDDPDFVAYTGTKTGTGTGTGTGTVTGITGTWVVTSFHDLGFSNTTEISRQTSTSPSEYDFVKIVFDDVLKTATVFVFTLGGTTFEKNTTYTTGTGTITFAKNPFLSTDTERLTPIKITVTGSTMRLVFVDPQGAAIGGGITLYAGAEAVLSRQ